MAVVFLQQVKSSLRSDIVTIRRVLTRFMTRCTMAHGETLYYCIACRKSGPEFQTGSGAGRGRPKVVRKFQRFIFKNTVALRIVRFGLTPTITPFSISIIYHLINSKELFLRFNLQDSSKRCLKKKKTALRFILISNFLVSSSWKKKISRLYSPLEFRFSQLSQRWQRSVFSFRPETLGLMHSWRARTNSTTTLIKYIVYVHEHWRFLRSTIDKCHAFP